LDEIPLTSSVDSGLPCSLATKVNSFHVIFYLNEVLIATCFNRGFNTVIPCPGLKEFFKKCLAQFQVYNWSAPPSSLMDSTTNPKVKIVEEGVGACSLAYNTLGVEGCVGALGSQLGRLTKNSITNTDLHKPNNKLVSV
jgi:hypothetical protein